MTRMLERSDASEPITELEHLASVGSLMPATVHDFRNPINVIKTSIYYLQNKLSEADPRLARHLDLINKACATAAQAMEDVTQYATGRPPVLSRMHPGVAIERGVQASTADAPALQSEIDPDLPEVVSSPDLLELLVKKLIQSARLRAGEVGSVLFHARSSSEGLLLVAKDGGASVSVQQSEVLFRPLVGPDGPRSTNIPTALITEITRLHAGTVTCIPGDGAGNSVQVQIPAVQPQ